MGAFRLGLVGGGRMGRTHIRALTGSSAVTFAAVAEPSEAAAAQLRALGLTVYPNVDEMLAAGGIDAVVIAAPTDQHLRLIEQIAAAGLPILCEKPCGLSSAQVAAAGAAAARHGVALQVAYWRRFVPALQDLQQRIAEGKLGVPHFVVCAQWDQAPPAAQFRGHSGGIFVDMGVHEIDQLRWLTGQDVTEVHAVAFPTVEDETVVGDADSAQALLTLSDGCAALVSLGRFHPDGEMVEAEVYGSGDHRRITVLDPADGEAAQLDALRRQAGSFARYVAGGPAQGATVQDARAVMAVAERLSAAAGLTILGVE